MCTSCVLGLHEECEADLIEEADHLCCCFAEIEEELPLPAVMKKPRTKDREEVRDPISTGRKEAARVKPIPMEGMICEWAGLSHAGGGVIPIVGCRDTFITSEKGIGKGNIHHGPDKDTLNNALENLHRICASCHNRWHTLNDKYYSDERPKFGQYLPLSGECEEHDPESKATETQFKLSQIYWAKKSEDRKKLDYREFVDLDTGL